MNRFIETYQGIWGDNPLALLDEYDYHPTLTAELDALDSVEFNHELFYKIVLWKLSRFPDITDTLMAELKNVAAIPAKEHEKARNTLTALLKTPGIALPMASTVLRFLNPDTFQIIDDRAYRVLMPDAPKYPAKPRNITQGYLDRSVTLYFNYLSRLHEVATDTLPFAMADRILYQLDIKLGNKIGRQHAENSA